MKKKLRVSVLGATGYGGGEVLRLLIQSNEFEIVHATSRNRAGVAVGDVHRNLYGVTDLSFSNPGDDVIAAQSDFIIGALPHAASAETLAPLVDRGKRVIDLSGDFRLKSPDVYREWYGHVHPRPELLKKAVYGCTELYATRIAKASLVAAPGCFATSINLALLPAAKKKLISGAPVVTAMTGSSGSGAEAKSGTHHPTRAQTIRPYKVLSHQHTPEIVQLAREAGSPIGELSFIPVSAPLVRGILACVSFDLGEKLSQEQADRLYKSFYRASAFVKVLTDREPECAAVAGTNYAEVRARVGRDGRLHVVTAIDNLLKGGAGQAVECLYMMAGIDPIASRSPLSWAGMWP